jgi:TetR/AcrR family transcriptional regulator
MPKVTFFNLAAEKRQRIIDLSIDEFAENNYKNASISKIVARAEIAKGSFYQYFEDKQDLYLYLIQVSGDEKAEFLRQTPPPDTKNIFDHIRWLISIGLSFEFSNPKLAQIGYRAIFDDAPLPEETRQIIEEGGLNFFTQMVENGKTQGAIDPGLDSHTVAFLFNAVFMNLGTYLLKRYQVAPKTLLEPQAKALDQPEILAAIEQVLTILERGLGIESSTQTQ